MKIRTFFQWCIIMTALTSTGAALAFSQENPLGQFEGRTDVGSPKLSGSASCDTAIQRHSISEAVGQASGLRQGSFVR